MQFALDETQVGHVQKVGQLPRSMIRIGRRSVDVAKSLAYRPLRSPIFT
jgi:hypothetical protein